MSDWPEDARVSTGDIRADTITRLSESAKRWRGIGRLALSQGNQDGHDSIRMANRMGAIVNVLRSHAHRHVIDDAFIRRYKNQPAGRLADLIQDRFPARKIPGYTERA